MPGITHKVKNRCIEISCYILERKYKKRIAACAGEFQPYGAIPLANLHSLAARTIIDLILNRFPDSSFAYSYLGRQEELVELGGQWNNCWINKFGNPNKGDRIISLIYENSNWMNNDA